MRNSKSVGIAIALMMLLALTCGAHFAWGQEVTAAITGTVTDPSGAPIVGAAVTARDVARDTTYPTETNGDGFYYLAQLPVGKYELRVEAKGFQTALRPAFELVLNQTARVDVQMTVGSVTETMQVSGAAPLLQTDSTQLGTLINSRTAESLPLSTGNINQLTLLAPGVVTPNLFGFQAAQNTFGTGRPYVNGAREQENNFLLDGLDNNQPDNNDVAYVPAPDAIQEFNLITGNAPADFGNYLGGVVNVTIKSGTNQYHGGVYEYFRNSGLNANSFFNNADGLPRPGLHYNRFGALLGGPIRKDKLFFFADYEESLFSQPATSLQLQTLPLAERTGNFSALCTAGFTAGGLCNNPTQQLYDPTSSANPATRTPFLNNQVPVGMFSSAAKAIINSPLYPSTQVANYLQKFTTNSYQGDIKIDYVLSDKDRISGRYSQQSVRNPTTQTFALASNGFTNNLYPLRNGVVDWNHAISSSLINDFRAGLSYFPVSQGFSNPTGQNLPQKFGIANSPSEFLPGISRANGSTSPFSDGTTALGNDLAQFNTFNDTEIHIGDSILKSQGNHELHFGFQFNRFRDNFLYPGNEGLAGFFAFTGQYTGNNGNSAGADIADFLLGLPTSVGIGAGTGNRHVQNSLYSLYAQDNWRIRRNVTLNLGLRWELNTPRASNEDNAVNYSLLGGNIITQTVNNSGLGDALYKQYNGITNFQPRIGVAWQPDFLKNTVIRAAYGVSNFVESNGLNNLLTANPPFQQNHNVTYLGSSNLPGSTFDQGFDPRVFPTGCTLALAQTFDPTCFKGVNIHAFNTDLRPEVHYQWNLSIQKQFGNATTVQIAYVGQDNQHLSNIIMLQQKQLNPDGTVSPSPFLNPTLLSEVGQARYTTSNGVSTYNALQATLQERFHNGLQAQVNYTWSKCLSDTPGFYGQFGDNVATEAQTIGAWAFPQDPYNQIGDYGRCPQDIRHLFNGYVVYELPFGRGKQFANNVGRALDLVVGGWRVSSSFIFHTGFAQTIFAAADLSGTAGFSTRANCVSGVPSKIPMTFDPLTGGVHFLNPAAVTNPGPGTFGTCPVGAFDGPGLKTADLSIAKDFHITERQSLEFRADMTNFTNTPIFNFGQEYSGQHTAGAANYGEIFTSQGSRQIQFALKYTF